MKVYIEGLSLFELGKALEDAGVQLNDFAKVLLAAQFFDETVSGEYAVSVVTLTDLGLLAPASLDAIYARAQMLGYSLCPLELAPYARLQMLNQVQSTSAVLAGTNSMPEDAINVASPVISDDHSFPKGFYVRVVDGVPWLRGYRCDYTYLYPVGSRFMFVRHGTRGHGK